MLIELIGELIHSVAAEGDLRRPTFMPARSLKFAMDFLDLVTMGFWPAMVVSSVTASSSALALSLQSPRPMLMTIFSRRGISITFLYWNFC